MKSNEQFARKCISNIPRLKNRPFRMVLVVKRTVMVMSIKSADEVPLQSFFNSFQQFLINHDILATPVMGIEGDLFVNFDLFQFQAGLYANTSVVDFLTSVTGEFYHHQLVDNGFPGYTQGSKKQLDDDIIMRRLPVPLKHLRSGGEVTMKLRRYIPGPTGLNDGHTYHTTPWAAWGTGKDNHSLADLINEKHVVIIADQQYPDQLNGPTIGHRDLSFALTIAEFLDYAERRHLDVSSVDFDGRFTIKRKLG
ncbi:hypothetical protein pEaSNUABM37_00207 [Erwinia phage pEa_SNUABM_37]|nr:hypothetical protein pEaSNUABM37_00207 [Erwinia phage pEa_SNUABM_37]QXO10677.1 hypothetical protein pEaSNUABM48_00207 [Erwinia phage pEa_SNUABM_48]